ncbi:MAG: hypothetical protein IJ060_08710 [Oscillospiraceae bacterium]|nr:hypothetical protein [Oscillospiraceae bacterium]
MAAGALKAAAEKEIVHAIPKGTPAAVIKNTGIPAMGIPVSLLFLAENMHQTQSPY